MSTKNKKIRRFNPNEDKLIINEIKNSPTNLSFAFKNASRQLIHRTPEACSSRYYTALRNNQAIIAIGSEKGLLVNTKNTRQTVSKDIFNAKLRDDLLITAFSSEESLKIKTKHYMETPTIKHTSINNRPVMGFESPYKTGPNKGKIYAISYSTTYKYCTLIGQGGSPVKNNTEFPLETILSDYISHHGIAKAVSILIGKGIINPVNRPIIIIPDNNRIKS